MMEYVHFDEYVFVELYGLNGYHTILHCFLHAQRVC